MNILALLIMLPCFIPKTKIQKRTIIIKTNINDEETKPFALDCKFKFHKSYFYEISDAFKSDVIRDFIFFCMFHREQYQMYYRSVSMRNIQNVTPV